MTAETDLVKACLSYLELCGAFVWRNNSGQLRDRTGRPVRFGKVGSADIIGVWTDGKFLAVECKIGRNTPTAQQDAFLDAVAAHGGHAIVARSVDDIVEWAACDNGTPQPCKNG